MTTSPHIEPARSGVYRMPWDAGTTLAVDLENVRDKKSLLREIAAAVGFPKTFGGNWDALADSLQDLSWRPESQYVLTLRGADAARRALGAEWETLIEILEETASYWRARNRAFVVFVDTAEALREWR